MQPIIYIRSYEYFLLPVYIFLFFLLVRHIGKKHYAGTIQYYYLQAGFLAKIFGSIVFALMSQFFFKEGDTFMYFSAGLDFKEAFFKSFPDHTNLLFLDSESFGKFYEQTYDMPQNYGYVSAPTNLFAAKISAACSLLGLNGYLLTSLFWGMIAFSGMWQVFIIFSRRFADITKQLSWILLFMPSILYWGGGIMKDTLCLGAIGWLFYGFHNLLFTNTKRIYHLCILLIASFVLFNLKAYIAVTMIGILSLWLLIHSIAKIRADMTRKMVSLVLLFVALILLISNFDTLPSLALQSASDAINSAQKSYEWLSENGGATIQTFGEITPTISGIFSKAPQALSNALFRPFLWESSSLNILFSAVENTFLLGLAVFALIKNHIFFFKRVFSDQLIAISFIFSIIFAVMIGFTCFNVGSIVRYKLPCLPFLGVVLIFLIYKKKTTGTKPKIE